MAVSRIHTGYGDARGQPDQFSGRDFGNSVLAALSDLFAFAVLARIAGPGWRVYPSDQAPLCTGQASRRARAGLHNSSAALQRITHRSATCACSVTVKLARGSTGHSNSLGSR